MNTRLILTYLTELSENNERAWYHAHKKAYQEALAAFDSLLRALISKIRAFDSDIPSHKPRELTFRLARDTRFSRDKSPYLPAFRAHIAPKGKLPVPVGYYLMIRPGDQSFLGGGLFSDQFADATARVRDYLDQHGEQWEKIITAPAFQAHFTVKGAALKRTPSAYRPDHPQAAYLKHKSWYLSYPLTDAQLMDDEAFLEQAAAIFKQMKPFNDYLNQALAGFQMPKR